METHLDKRNSFRFNSSFVYITGMVLSVVSIVIVSISALWGIQNQSQLLEKLYRHPFTVSTNVLEADVHLVAMHRYMKDVVIARDPTSLSIAIDLVSQNEKQVLYHLQTAKQEFLGSKERFQQVIDAVIGWRHIRNEVILLSQQKRYEEAADITINKGADYVRFLNQEMSGLVAFARNKANEFRESSRKQRTQIKAVQLLVSSIVILVVVVAMTLMYRRLRHYQEDLLEKEHRLRAIYNGVPVSIWDEDFSLAYKKLEHLRQSGVTDLRSHLQLHPGLVDELVNSIRVHGVNATSLKLFAVQNQSQLISSIATTFGEGAMSVFVDALCAIWNKETLFVAKANYRALDGRDITGQISIPLPQSKKEAYFVPVVIEDITQKELNDIKLRLLASVFTESQEGICIVSPDAKIVEVNQAFSDITGYTRDESLGRNPNFLKSGRHDEAFYSNMWKSLADKGLWQGEIWNRKKSGEIFPEILTISSIKNAERETVNYVGLFSDISNLKAHEEELNHLAHYDPLTDLPNRVLFADRLGIAMAQARRTQEALAVAYVDLDGFKTVNDTYGHDVGDLLLIAVANAMKTMLREVDTVARIGGDEFVIIFVDVKSKSELEMMLNRVLQGLAQPFVINATELSISVSIGVTLYPQSDNIEGDQLQRQADQAMYEAKLAGRNRYRFFDPKNDTEISQKLTLLCEVERAITDSEFVLYFQPKLNMKSGEIKGAEALIRWQHPQRGLLMPAEFLPMMENDHISIALGEWVIKNTLEHIADWKKQGISTPISVNISARQLQQKDFIEKLKAIMAMFPMVEPAMLQLEILETSALNDFEWVAEVVKECEKLGVAFALDDFGSGYASLMYLKKLPVTTMKIDQEFVLSILENTDDQTILAALLHLAESFNMQTIAEGVETPEHVALLLEQGCLYGQGYAISRPLTAEDFVAWNQNWQPRHDWQRQTR